MARIAGRELNDKWRLVYALTHIKGIGWSTARKVIASLKYDESTRLSDLSRDDVAKIAQELDKFIHEGDLLREVQKNVSRMQQIGTYKGMRHSKGLPARGQRTKSNARTKRGKRKTVGSFRKDALAKMQGN